MSDLSLCLSGWDNFPSDLKMCKEVQNLHKFMFSVFLLKHQDFRTSVQKLTVSAASNIC